MKPVERRHRKVVEALEENATFFDPMVEGLAEACKRGGRILLICEGRLDLLARYLAGEIVARRHKNGGQLPADLLDCASGDPQAIARRVGPYDAILAVATTCEDALFAGALEAAKARGGRIFCVCLGRARVEGKVSVAVDVFESRPHYMPGHVAMVLHFISKRVLARIGASPLMRPTRLDSGPPRPLGSAASSSAAASVSAAEAAPLPALAPITVTPGGGPAAAPSGPVSPVEEVSELVIDLEPDDADVRLVELDARAAADALGAGAEEGAGEVPLPPPPVPPDAEGRVRLIQFRCKDCREPILAEPIAGGARARCPFCGRRVKVPRHSGRLYRPVAPALSQGPKPVTLRFVLAECRLAIAAPGGGAELVGAIEDVSTDGIEALIGAAEARALEIGGVVELRVEAPAFLEPLVTTATVERVIAPGGAAEGRARALLPLHESATREARAMLARLAELASQGPTAERAQDGRG